MPQHTVFVPDKTEKKLQKKGYSQEQIDRILQVNIEIMADLEPDDVARSIGRVKP